MKGGVIWLCETLVYNSKKDVWFKVFLNITIGIDIWRFNKSCPKYFADTRKKKT